jgi:hypothetical protein
MTRNTIHQSCTVASKFVDQLQHRPRRVRHYMLVQAIVHCCVHVGLVSAVLSMCFRFSDLVIGSDRRGPPTRLPVKNLPAAIKATQHPRPVALPHLMGGFFPRLMITL